MREGRGYTQRELSRALGRNHDYVGSIERGDRGVIGIFRVEEIANTLGVHASVLTTKAELERYLSPENRRENNLPGREAPDGGGGILGKVFALFFALFKDKGT